MKTIQRSLGDLGEKAVCDFLKTQGYSILQTNYSCLMGEIDIIAKHNELIVFVEVKTRKTAYFALSSVVTQSKQSKIIKTAKHFIVNQKLSNYAYRFDVATVLATNNKTDIDYIPNAFYGA